ncbi:MAG TPA: serine hydrolase domain-containing protein, partial [Ilumatobacteraceae bacterium]|nr:serine hydrolase domain-containing protein [Ilumatobacteraceae bacterium]
MLNTTAVNALRSRIQAEIDDGHSQAAQFALGLDGEVVAAESFGAATDDSRFVIFSSTKAIVAMSLLPHLSDGSIELTAPVARYLPGFGDNGKDGVTVLQLLTMQGGFPQALIGPDSWGTSEGRRRQFSEWTLAWPSGTRTEYHPIAAHWVIAELIETLSGRPYVEVVNERVPAAAGVPNVLGPSELGPVITIRTAGSVPDHAHLLAAFGREDLVPDTTVSPELLLALNDPRAQAAAIPGGGGIARAVDMATIYQSFLHNPNDAHPGDWLADARGTVRNASIMANDGTPANRTIAGVVSGADGMNDYRWLPHTPRAFGHAGAGGQLNWVDADSGLSFSFLHDTLQLDP